MTACDRETPAQVWVPADGYRAGLDVSVVRSSPGPVAVGEWIRLKAQRRSGPWVRVRAATLDRSASTGGAVWLPRPPPLLQPDAQSSVHWLVDPPGQAQFNLPGAAHPHDRQVRFHAPGTYVVWGQAFDRVWGEVESSNRLTVVVERR